MKSQHELTCLARNSSTLSGSGRNSDHCRPDFCHMSATAWWPCDTHTHNHTVNRHAPSEPRDDIKAERCHSISSQWLTKTGQGQA